MGQKILLVEDDTETGQFLIKGLKEEGHVVDHAAEGRDGLFMASDLTYNLIILDRMIPGMDGISLLRAIRAANVRTPVLMLSALASVDDRIFGLECGSDDYLVKPFAFAELLARANVLMRRGPDASLDGETIKLVVADLELNLLTRVVRRGGKAIDLKPREYSLLEYFMRNSDRVVTRTMLLEHVWGYHFDPATNVVDVHVSRLRKRLDDGHTSTLLQTVRGAGYRLIAH